MTRMRLARVSPTSEVSPRPGAGTKFALAWLRLALLDYSGEGEDGADSGDR